jgi:hypothetical protein
MTEGNPFRLILAVALAAVFGPGLDSVGHLFGWW